MVILIAGPTHSGKTVLMGKLIEVLHYPAFSIDHLKMGLIRSKNTYLTVMDDEKLTGYLWPIVREIIKTAIENDQNLILEGCYIPYNWKQDFGDQYLSKIRFFCLSLSEEFIELQFDEILKHENDAEKRFPEPDLTKEFLIKENRICAEGFRKAGENPVCLWEDPHAFDRILQDCRKK